MSWPPAPVPIATASAMERVLVIGSPGAGKSTLAARLAARTGLPLFHIDQLYWNAGWVESDRADFDRRLAAVTRQPRWIIDGNYGRSLPARLAHADTVIDLDLAPWRCVARVIGRVAGARGAVRPDMAPDCPERFDLAFLGDVLHFRRDRRPRMEAHLARFDGRRVRLRSPTQVRAFLASLGAGS